MRVQRQAAVNIASDNGRITDLISDDRVHRIFSFARP